MAMTSIQHTNARRLLADKSIPPAFSNTELDDFLTLAGENYYLAIAFCFRTLQADAAKFNQYSIGQTSEHKEQIFNQLAIMASYWEDWSRSSNQIQITGMRPVPPRRKARPTLQGGGSYWNGQYSMWFPNSVDWEDEGNM